MLYNHWYHLGLEKNITLEYLKKLQSSEPLHAKMNPTSCLLGSRFAQNPVFLVAGALQVDEKIRQSAALSWFGLRDVGILYSLEVVQRTIDVSPAFLEHGLLEKNAVGVQANLIQTSRILINFCMKRLRTSNSFQIFKIKNKNNNKTIQLMSCSRPIQWYHSHADLIWPDGIFTHAVIYTGGTSNLAHHVTAYREIVGVRQASQRTL
jgi:hypothetical protein